MRYILDSSGYIEEVSFSNEIVCHNDTCTEYTGLIPSGYNSLSEWSINANIRAYKIVNGNLTYDSVRDAELQSEWSSQETSTTPELSINKVTSISSSSTNTEYPSAKCVYDKLSDKQDTLTSGTNIKTINNESILGSGNINIEVGAREDANRLNNYGTPDNTGFAFYQTSSGYFNSSVDWAHYLISSHGNGNNYFHYMLRLPFWGVPQYQRMEAGSLKGWQTFITTENCYPVIGGAIGTGTSSASGAWVTVQTAYLAAGTYVVSALCRWSTNGSGYRRATITTDGNSTNIDTAIAPSPSSITQVTVAKVMQISANNTPVYFRMSQNSGSSLTQYCQFNIMRVG